MLVQGQNNINRAIDGDIVAVEVFHESQWANFMEMMNSSDSDSGSHKYIASLSNSVEGISLKVL